MRVDRIANFINKSKATQCILRRVNDNAALYGTAIGFICASGLRPLGIMALPMKDKKDKAYSIGSAVATGLSELAFTGALFVPINKWIGKTSKSLYSSTDSIYSKNNLLLRNYKSINNRLFKLLALPLTAMVRFALISPIVKMLFKKEGKK